MKILLVEPSYKNKYPPMGLMKISTYHKNKGDQVVFFKGLMPKKLFLQYGFDRVYITTLFTFYYNKIVKTIKFYQNIFESSQIYVGGIVATLMADKLKTDIDSCCHILKGLLTDSAMLGFKDGVNIDELPLDYAILDDVDYEYPAGDSYLAYVSRGCTNKCSFCAVPILEPKFALTNNIISQVRNISTNHGTKQNLLLLDNNILSFKAETLKKIVDDIRAVGFDKETKFYNPLPLVVYLDKLSNPGYSDLAKKNILANLLKYLQQKKAVKKSKSYQDLYLQIMTEIEQAQDKFAAILEHKNALQQILSNYYRPSGRKRYIDFNQGIDARQLTDEKMAVLANLPIEPFRLAFDSVGFAKTYINAMEIASKHGIKRFSNYILYNFEDKPEELWERLYINICLAKKLKIKIFSFPMKYAPIDRCDRQFIGSNWNKQYLSNVYAILNVTKGIVADGEEFFLKAFGNNLEEYLEILTMPREFVTYRKHFEELGITKQWQMKFRQLDPWERKELLVLLSAKDLDKNALCSPNKKIAEVLNYYKIKKQSIMA